MLLLTLSFGMKKAPEVVQCTNTVYPDRERERHERIYPVSIKGDLFRESPLSNSHTLSSFLCLLVIAAQDVL